MSNESPYAFINNSETLDLSFTPSPSRVRLSAPLRYLTLHGTRFSASLSEIIRPNAQYLRELEFLDLSNCDLTHLPPATLWSTMPSLTYLDLRSNRISDSTQYSHLSPLPLIVLRTAGNPCRATPTVARDAVPTLRLLDAEILETRCASQTGFAIHISYPKGVESPWTDDPETAYRVLQSRLFAAIGMPTPARATTPVTPRSEREMRIHAAFIALIFVVKLRVLARRRRLAAIVEGTADGGFEGASAAAHAIVKWSQDVENVKERRNRAATIIVAAVRRRRRRVEEQARHRMLTDTTAFLMPMSEIQRIKNEALSMTSIIASPYPDMDLKSVAEKSACLRPINPTNNTTITTSTNTNSTTYHDYVVDRQAWAEHYAEFITLTQSTSRSAALASWTGAQDRTNSTDVRPPAPVPTAAASATAHSANAIRIDLRTQPTRYVQLSRDSSFGHAVFRKRPARPASLTIFARDPRLRSPMAVSARRIGHIPCRHLPRQIGTVVSTYPRADADFGAITTSHTALYFVAVPGILMPLANPLYSAHNVVCTAAATTIQETCRTWLIRQKNSKLIQQIALQRAAIRIQTAYRASAARWTLLTTVMLDAVRALATDVVLVPVDALQPKRQLSFAAAHATRFSFSSTGHVTASLPNGLPALRGIPPNAASNCDVYGPSHLYDLVTRYATVTRHATIHEAGRGAFHDARDARFLPRLPAEGGYLEVRYGSVAEARARMLLLTLYTCDPSAVRYPRPQINPLQREDGAGAGTGVGSLVVDTGSEDDETEWRFSSNLSAEQIASNARSSILRSIPPPASRQGSISGMLQTFCRNYVPPFLSLARSVSLHLARAGQIVEQALNPTNKHEVDISAFMKVLPAPQPRNLPQLTGLAAIRAESRKLAPIERMETPNHGNSMSFMTEIDAPAPAPSSTLLPPRQPATPAPAPRPPLPPLSFIHAPIDKETAFLARSIPSRELGALIGAGAGSDLMVISGGSRHVPEGILTVRPSTSHAELQGTASLRDKRWRADSARRDRAVLRAQSAGAAGAAGEEKTHRPQTGGVKAAALRRELRSAGF